MTKEINGELLELTLNGTGCKGCYLFNLQKSTPSCLDLTESRCLKTTMGTINLIWELKKKIK